MKTPKTYIFELVTNDGQPVKMVQSGEKSTFSFEQRIHKLCQADPTNHYVRTTIVKQ